MCMTARSWLVNRIRRRAAIKGEPSGGYIAHRFSRSLRNSRFDQAINSPSRCGDRTATRTTPGHGKPGPRTLEELGRRSADRHGELGEDGQIDRLVLNLLHEGQTLGRVADYPTEKHPTRFDTWEKALGRVGDVSDRYRMTGNR